MWISKIPRSQTKNKKIQDSLILKTRYWRYLFWFVVTTNVEFSVFLSSETRHILNCEQIEWPYAIFFGTHFWQFLHKQIGLQERTLPIFHPESLKQERTVAPVSVARALRGGMFSRFGCFNVIHIYFFVLNYCQCVSFLMRTDWIGGLPKNFPFRFGSESTYRGGVLTRAPWVWKTGTYGSVTE